MTWDRMFNAAEAGVQPVSNTLPPMMSARDLQIADFPPVSWIVPDLLPEGVTLFAGKPKLGKSWLALQLGYGISAGNEVLGRPVGQGSVLYAALEDNARRLKKRLQRIARADTDWPERLQFSTDWPRLDAGGLARFYEWISQTPDARLLIIDTLATVRPATGGKDSQYQSDYAAIRGLHGLANETGIGILVVHHVRKMDADDPFDTVSGSTGLTGAADTTLVLSTTSEGKVLYGRGRDLAEFECAMDFDAETCRWSDLGRPCDVFGSETRKAIREALKAGHQTPKDIAEHGGLEYDLCAKTLQRMAESGEVEKGGRGRYRRKPDTP
ncbi:MAG: AAA family ATPase [Silicimonas sp.]|nr:AAA family ATPase [Silicimonas sp.]